VAPLSDVLHKVVWRTECAVIFSDCRSMPNHPIMKQHADFITGGWSADSSAGVIIHPYMLIPEPRGQFIDTTYRWYRRTSRFWLHKLFNQDFLRRTLPELKDIFCGTFERLEADTNIQLYEIWNWYQRQARMTMSTGHVDSHLFEKVDPIRDRDYMDFTLTLPTRLRFDRSLYKAMIYEVAPELRDIPDASTDFTVGRTVAENLFKTCVSFGQLTHKKVLKTIGIHKQKRFMGDTAESLQVVTRQDPELRGVVEDFVHSDYFDGAIFNKAGILDVLDMHYRGAANFAYPLCYLATFAVGLPYFVYNRPESCPPEAEPLQIHTNGRVH
jgi:hypothetical protein